MIVLACGSRDWDQWGVIEYVLSTLHFQRRISKLIHGACRGADRMAGELARRLAIEVQEYPADWKKFGKRAGPIRNRRMLTDGRPNLILAFHDSLTHSKGTRDMVESAMESSIEVWVISSNGNSIRYPPGSRIA